MIRWRRVGPRLSSTLAACGSRGAQTAAPAPNPLVTCAINTGMTLGYEEARTSSGSGAVLVGVVNNRQWLLRVSVRDSALVVTPTGQPGSGPPPTAVQTAAERIRRSCSS